MASWRKQPAPYAFAPPSPHHIIATAAFSPVVGLRKWYGMVSSGAIEFSYLLRTSFFLMLFLWGRSSSHSEILLSGCLLTVSMIRLIHVWWFAPDLSIAVSSVISHPCPCFLPWLSAQRFKRLFLWFRMNSYRRAAFGLFRWGLSFSVPSYAWVCIHVP